MEKTILMKLELCAPLFYTKINHSPEDPVRSRGCAKGMDCGTEIADGMDYGARIAECMGKSEEIILCFVLNSQESNNIEPNRSKFLEKMLFIGKKEPSSATSPCRRLTPPREPFSNAEKEPVLPAGRYLFAQNRGDRPLDREEWLDMAIEQQKDGLWERNKPGNLLYVRYLFEDGAYATQVFRPL